MVVAHRQPDDDGDNAAASRPLEQAAVLPPPAADNTRWLVLTLNCFILMGNYYAYDNPAAMSTLLETYLELPKAQFDYTLGLFYSVYSFPNIVLPFFSGYFIDRFGPKYVLLFLSACVCTGQAIFAAGVSSRNVPVMLIGRVLFGIGGESVSVAQSCVTTKWFLHRELAFALGLNLAVPRVGSVLNATMSPAIAIAWNRRQCSQNDCSHSTGSGVVLSAWIGCGMCVLSMLSAVALVFFVGTEPPADFSRSQLCFPSQSAECAGDEATGCETAPLLANNNNIRAKPSLTLAGTVKEFVRSNIRIFRSFPVEFWLLCIIVMLVYGTIIPFNNIISEFLQSKWYGDNPATAGQVMGIPDTICAFLVPFCGYAIDRYGRRASALVACCLTIMSVHLTLAFTPAKSVANWIVPVLPLIALGVSYSVYGVAFWSAIACVFGAEQDTTPVDVYFDGEAETSLTTTVTPPPLLSRNLSSVSLGRLSTTSLPLLAAARAISTLSSAGPSPLRSVTIGEVYEPPLDGTVGTQNNNSNNANNNTWPSRHSNAPLFHVPTLTDITVDASDDIVITASADHLAVAYGLSTSALNLALTVVPVLTATISEYNNDNSSTNNGPTALRSASKFVPVELFFAVEAFTAALAGCVIVWMDYRYHGGRKLERQVMS